MKILEILFVIYKLDYADQIAISYLSAIAKQLGHLTYFCSIDTTDLTSTIIDIKPDVVSYTVNVLGYQKILEEHKKALNNDHNHKFVSIMGGPQATFSPETFSESGMDAYCVGEGEYAFRDFLIRIEKHESYDDVLNLITKNKENEIVTNPVRPLIANLDELPLADRDLTISNSYLRNTPKKTFYATRGCPFGCSYCCNNHYNELYKGKGPIIRRFSVERIIKEIEYVKSKYRTDFVKFGDDLFVIKADEWLEEFAEKYSKRIGIPFNCYLRFDTVDDDLLRLLKKAGCYSVHLSVDSTSNYIRENILKRKMKRNIKNVDIINSLKKIRKYGINTLVNYMLAVPESTLQDDLDSIDMNRKSDVTYANYSTTVPMKGNELYDYCMKKGIVDLSTYKGDMTDCFEKSKLTCFSNKEIDIRYNIFLLGHIASKIPSPFHKLVIFIIKNVPPNSLFRMIRDYYYIYNHEHTIFKLK